MQLNKTMCQTMYASTELDSFFSKPYTALQWGYLTQQQNVHERRQKDHKPYHVFFVGMYSSTEVDSFMKTYNKV
jgi:hypothetical protein